MSEHDAPATGATEPDVEVTSEMIEAVRDELAEAIGRALRGMQAQKAADVELEDAVGWVNGDARHLTLSGRFDLRFLAASLSEELRASECALLVRLFRSLAVEGFKYSPGDEPKAV